MLMSRDVHDQTYQFFIEEVPELLQIIETGLLTLRAERTPHKLHELMRAAHSLKGGAAIVGLESITTIAHRLEDIFRDLYDETLEIDADLEGLLLQAYDCLQVPLTEQIQTGHFNPESALTSADPIFTQIEAKLGDRLAQAIYHIPDSVDLNVDMVASVFTVDIADRLDYLHTIVANPQNYKIDEELRAQVEVFARFAEFLELPGFKAIAETTLAALLAHPDRALHIAELARADFQAGRSAVLAGDRAQGGSPSADLIALAENTIIDEIPLNLFDSTSVSLNLETLEETSSNLFEPAIASSNIKPAPPLSLEELLSKKPFTTQASDDSPTSSSATVLSQIPEHSSIQPVAKQEVQIRKQAQEQFSTNTSNISVRVDLTRLERMNNLLGELTINRNIFALENEQIQAAIQELLHRFERFQEATKQIQNISDMMLVASESTSRRHKIAASKFSLTEFDSLEMDRYGDLYSSLQDVLEEVAQLKEAVDDIAMFSGRSNRTIRQERQMLSQLRDELMWSRMLPIGNVLSHFPRMIRDMSTTYHKPVNLKLTGTEVQVEKAIVEKLYDPLLHLLRNAFDHGIEPPELRHQQGKLEQGEIEIRAYHHSNQTIIEVRDDGQGLNLERICLQALERGLLSPEQLAEVSTDELFETIFEPGFSTASQVSELSGRGVGLDVVKSELQSLKGNITVTSSPGQGTTFTLRLPFTLTIAKLLVCSMGFITVALPIDSIVRIIKTQGDRTDRAGERKFLTWQEQSVPVYQLIDLLEYNCPSPKTFSSNVASTISADNKTPPLLLLRREQQMFALEVDCLVAEQELAIKPFGAIVPPPNYISGCTVLGDGSLIPVINGAMLLEDFLKQSKTGKTATPHISQSLATDWHSINNTHFTPTVLVVDDSATARQALVFTLEKAGYRVLQARDGWEAIEQLHLCANVQLMICDVEMPNMNGFEFLDYRLQDPQLAKIPVAMLTTRSNRKHRDLAMALGASAYFTKPYIELELLSALKNIIGQA
ncbi:hybrid sensor histidine kinase/response regulator [Scytonema hofmannii PCC 7110]|uniref:histidine kinase n=1 Tax=Scytonema hofmannii PCC 7110 TaxID=128403 RepID=A0A139X241_9CYAN|nr:response regulator [Scytonema hofmannii]KYC38779.1 hybrid sensor histidine kinase/response regulator [Scytonema hofmannii PCC 7110]